MLLDGLWMVHVLLALSSFARGNPVNNDPLAAPRVFISFKGRTPEPFLPSASDSCFSNWCCNVSDSSYSAGPLNSATCLLWEWLTMWQTCNWSNCGFDNCSRFLQRKNLEHHQTLALHRRADHKQIMHFSFRCTPPQPPSPPQTSRHCNNHQMLPLAYTVQTIKKGKQ